MLTTSSRFCTERGFSPTSVGSRSFEYYRGLASKSSTKNEYLPLWFHTSMKSNF